MPEQKTKLYLCITKSNWGGAQKYVYDIATNIPKDKFDVTVLLGGLVTQAGYGELKKRLDEVGVKTQLLKIRRDVNIKNDFNSLFELIQLFRKEKPNIIHLNSSKMGLIGAIAGRIAGIKKIIFIAHGWAFNEERPYYQKLFFRILHIITIIMAHKTISVSEITKKQIGWPWNKKIVVIKNGLTPISFIEKNKVREILTEKIGQIIPENTLWIGTISELHKTKGLKYVIEAISHIKHNVIFIIIGDGQERESLEKLVSAYKLNDKIFFLGRIESASNYVKAFDIFTLTSITEALPYVVLEAGSAGLPIIASNVGGIPEIIENDKTGILVQPRISEEIKNSIEYLIKNPEKAAAIGMALSDKINKEFKINKMVQETLKLY
jgi:glycosyltransferase involved in cell wall biosynthesis